MIISEYVNSDGNEVQIFDDGTAYYASDNCTLAGQIFDPDFFNKSYEETNNGISIIVDEGTRYPVKQNFKIDFENIDDWQDLLITTELERDRFFTNVTFQSPSTPEASSYNALQRCLISKECDFIDNRIDLIADPFDSDNQVLRFYAVAPSPDMVTSKSSIAGSTLFFQAGDDFWFQARYYIEKGRPLTIADFESEHFLGYMGPRLIFHGGELNVENKFAEKLTYEQLESPGIQTPMRQWFTVKVHLRYDVFDGIIQVWQDDQLIIDAKGKNIPLSIWVQSLLEVGISATQEETILLIDDVQFSNEEI